MEYRHSFATLGTTGGKTRAALTRWKDSKLPGNVNTVSRERTGVTVSMVFFFLLYRMVLIFYSVSIVSEF